MIKRTVFKVTLSIILLIVFFIQIISINETKYEGWMEVTDKNIIDGRYYLYVKLEGEPIEMIINEREKFVYEKTAQELNEVTISQVWGFIDTNKKYFVQMKNNRLKPTYQIEKLYGY